MINKNNVELLAPVGDKEVLAAAIDAGCDAVYLAGKSFGARAYANNFSLDELKSAIDYAHLYGVKVFVTVNTLVFDSEIDECVKLLDFLYLNNCDAVIVQDLGLASIIKTRYPKLRLHASTQINAQNYNDVYTLYKLGFDRVILGREVSIDTIKEIREKLDEDNIKMELEVFCHGALCISYSGGCYFSSLIGGRSGNRGRCAQPCRKEYTFNGKRGYFLSPKDLETIDYIQEISKYVDSLKIEGRMKSKEYVYNVVFGYKKALNNNLNKDEINDIKDNIKISFNRNNTKGFILNETNDAITNINSSNHSGILVGEVENSYKNEVQLRINKDLYFNDAIRFVNNGNTIDAITINNMYVNHNLVKVAKAGSLVNIKVHNDIPNKTKCFLTKREIDFSSKDFPHKKIDIIGFIKKDNNKLIIDFKDNKNLVSKEIDCEYSDKDFTERIKEQLSKTSDTVYLVKEIKGEVSNLFIPISVINQARRELLSKLDELRINIYERTINDCMPCIKVKKDDFNIKENVIAYDNELVNLDDLVDDLPVELEDSSYYIRNINYLPRICNEDNVDSNSIGTNIGINSYITSPYSNVLNSYTIRVLESLGKKIICVSIEASKDKIKEMIDSYINRYGEKPNLMVMVFGHYELMHMKHCFVNKAYGYKAKHCMECKKNIKFDGLYPVYGDKNCNLSILSKDCVNITKFKEELKNMGISHFLYDFTKVSDIEMSGLYNNNGGYYGHYIKGIE